MFYIAVVKSKFVIDLIKLECFFYSIYFSRWQMVFLCILKEFIFFLVTKYTVVHLRYVIMEFFRIKKYISHKYKIIQVAVKHVSLNLKRTNLVG